MLMIFPVVFFVNFQCNDIHYAVYSIKWYIITPRKAKNVIFVMARTHKPLNLTVGKMFPLTMATFCNVSHFKLPFYNIDLNPINLISHISFHIAYLIFQYYTRYTLHTSIIFNILISRFFQLIKTSAGYISVLLATKNQYLITSRKLSKIQP